MTRVVALAAISLAASVAGSSAAAQRVESSLDVSGTNVWYADSIRSGGPSMTPSLRIDWARATLSGTGSVSYVGGAGTSLQGSVVPSIFSPSVGPFAAELTGSAGGSTHTDGSRTGQSLGLVRLHAIGSGVGGWIGVGAGATWDGVVWRDVRQGDAGVWFQHSDMTTLATIAPVVVQDTIRYTDVQMAWRFPLARADLGATAGWRTGASGPAVAGSSRAWASLSVVAWLSRGLAIVASGGSYPVDFTQGYPGGHFLSIAMRIASREQSRSSRSYSTSPDPVSSGPTEPTVAAPATPAFEVRGTSTAREIRVYAPSANSVELNADFTQWQSLSLQRGADGWWSAIRPIPAGIYEVNLRMNGGPWLAPPGLMTSRDEFGGVVGILTIE